MSTVAQMKAKHFAHEWPELYYEAVQERRGIAPHTAHDCEHGHDKCSIIEAGPCGMDAWRRAND